jgi:signal transduction histidine kinase
VPSATAVHSATAPRGLHPHDDAARVAHARVRLRELRGRDAWGSLVRMDDAVLDARTFKRRITLVVAAPYALMALLSAVVAWQFLYILAAQRSMRETEQLVTQAERVREQVPDLESRVMAWLTLPGDKARTSFDHRAELVQQGLANIEVLAGGDADAQRLARDLAAEFARWRETVHAPPVQGVAGAGPAGAASQPGPSAAANARSEALTARLTEFIHTERARRARQRVHTRHAVHTVVGSGVALTLVLAAVLGFLARRQMLAMADSYRRALASEREHAEALARSEARLRALLAERDELLARVRDALSLRDEFLQVACHELRTPLTPLRMQVEAMQRSAQGAAGPMNREGLVVRLASVRRGVDRLAQLVQQMLEISQFTTGEVELSLREVNLSELVREAVARASEVHAHTGCTVTVDARLPVLGRWDPDRLNQVVAALLSNAMKFGCRRPVEVAVEGDAARARIEVRDHGAGISPQDHERIFQRFGRAVSERNYGGFGAGLWMSRTIVQAMGGSIRVASAPGQGATFTVDLPRASAAAVHASAGDAAAAAASEHSEVTQPMARTSRPSQERVASESLSASASASASRGA